MTPRRSDSVLRPSIELHIDELQLHGLPLTDTQGRIVQAVVEVELMRLLTEQGLNYSSAIEVMSVSAGTIQLTTDNKPANLGLRIAKAVHGGLTSGTQSQPTRSPDEAFE